MNGRDDPVTELDLLAYVDGHLEPARQRIVEAWLATHPDDARRVAADIAINDGIRRLFRDSYLETPPAHLTEALETRRPAVPVSVAAAIALVLGAVGLGGGWWAGRSDLPVAMPAAQQAPGGARLVAAADDTDAVDWLASHVSANIRLPDLRSAGLRLVGQSVVGGPNNRPCSSPSLTRVTNASTCSCSRGSMTRNSATRRPMGAGCCLGPTAPSCSPLPATCLPTGCKPSRNRSTRQRDRGLRRACRTACPGRRVRQPPARHPPGRVGRRCAGRGVSRS